MGADHDDVVQTQFGPRAQAYVDSPVHARGADLEALERLVRQAAPCRALDLGCGEGRLSRFLRSLGHLVAEPAGQPGRRARQQ